MTAPCGCVNGSCKGLPPELCRRKRRFADAQREAIEGSLAVEDWRCPHCGQRAVALKAPEPPDFTDTSTTRMPPPTYPVLICATGHEVEERRALHMTTDAFLQLPAGTMAAAARAVRAAGRNLVGELVRRARR